MCISGNYLGKGRKGTRAWRAWSLERGRLAPTWQTSYGNPWTPAKMENRTARARFARVSHRTFGNDGLHATRKRTQLSYEIPVRGVVQLGGDIARFEGGYLASEMKIVRLYVHVRWNMKKKRALQVAQRLRKYYHVPVTVVEDW